MNRLKELKKGEYQENVDSTLLKPFLHFLSTTIWREKGLGVI